MTKSEWRQWAKIRRSELPITQISDQACRNLSAWLRQRKLTHILIYSATNDEINPAPLRQLYPAVYYLPRTAGNTLTVHSAQSPLVQHPFGFWEPSKQAPIQDPLVLQAVLVPCLMVDKHGYRLGYGKGFYDRFLAELPQHIPTVGLVPQALVVDELPHDPWDIPLQFIANEHQVKPIL